MQCVNNDGYEDEIAEEETPKVVDEPEEDICTQNMRIAHGIQNMRIAHI